MSNASNNQRRLKRHSLNDQVEVYDTVRDICVGRLANIHTEGLMVIGTVALEADKLYQLHLQLPQPVNGCDSIQLGVDCLWVRVSDEDSMHWAGCQIIDISPGAVATITALVETLGL